MSRGRTYTLRAAASIVFALTAVIPLLLFTYTLYSLDLLGLTQAELAERIGVTRQTVIAIEQGRYSPSLEMAFRIARVFGVPLDDVFHYPESLEATP